MKSIEARFEKIKSENPYWSTYVCFSRAIDGQNFSRDRLRRYFNKLVDKDDYASNEKAVTLKYLYWMTVPEKRREAYHI